MSHLSKIKNPSLPLFVHSNGPAGLRLYTASLDIRTPWEPLLPSPAYPKLGFTTSQLGLADRLLCLVVSHILTIPCVLSLVNHCLLLYTLCLPLPRAYRRRKGDSSVPTTVLIPKGERDICVCFGYLLCLGPS